MMHVDDYGGDGEPLLFIHGWGMHGGMWGGVLEELAKQHRVLAVDLPGHGYSTGIQDSDRKGLPRTTKGQRPKLLCEGFRIQGEETIGKREEGRGKGKTVSPNPSPLSTDGANPSPFSLESIVDQLSAQFTGPLTVCGWSLGGQVALRWAMRKPLQVKRLVLVSSTPCFVQKTGWDCAMAPDVLAAFAAALQQDYATTLRRFLALQVRGAEQEREQLAILRSSLAGRGTPDLAALQAGLEILRDVDLRTALPQICQRTLVIAGARDTLTPQAASQYIAAMMPDARLASIAGAAHASFLSHREEFVKHIAGFLHE
ncbi:MAG: alpha/beta fold hydrolase [Gallionella sp.]|jgi:pimeloyl-[acyl-carrier protein] methyl ester esterase